MIYNPPMYLNHAKLIRNIETWPDLALNICHPRKFHGLSCSSPSSPCLKYMFLMENPYPIHFPLYNVGKTMPFAPSPSHYFYSYANLPFPVVPSAGKAMTSRFTPSHPPAAISGHQRP